MFDEKIILEFEGTMTKNWELLIIERGGKVRYWRAGEIAEMTHEQYLQVCYHAQAENPIREIIYDALQDGWESFSYNVSAIENSNTIAFTRLSKPDNTKPD